MPSADDPTDERVAFTWRTGAVEGATPCLHLAIAWFLDEPTRTGQVASIDRPSWLGRGLAGPGEPAPLKFHECRPVEIKAAAPVETTAISRRQLTFEPEGPDAVRVRCVGRRTLFHNGIETAECVARAGDTLALDLTALFMVEERVPELPASLHYPSPTFAFGAPDPDGLVGESAIAWELRDQLASAAASDDHVLVLGESGTGKELAAAVIHRLSHRRGGPFVARNAATFPDGLVDAELFGSARNYPNAGSPEREGLIGAAHGGTLFLDEIGELPDVQQAHLLRVLDRGAEYHRLGESRGRQSNFRLVAATNRGFDALKHDFLARLTTRVAIPPLHARASDIPLIARELLRRIAAESPGVGERFFEKGVARIELGLVDVLVRHRYTHHTRELLRLLRASVASSAGNYLALTPAVFEELGPPRTAFSSEDEIGSDATPTIGVDQLMWALRDAGGVVTRAADRLGISRHALRRLMKRYGVGEAR